MIRFPRLTKDRFTRFGGSTLLVILAAVLLFGALHVRAKDFSNYVTAEPSRDKPLGLGVDTIFRQEISVYPNQTLTELHLRFFDFGRTNKGTLTVKLFEDDTEITSWDFSTSYIPDSGIVDFTLPKPHKTRSESQYFITLSAHYRRHNEIAVWTSESGDGFEYGSDFQEGQSACYYLSYKCPLYKASTVYSLAIMLVVLVLILLNVKEHVLMTFVLAVLLVFYLALCPPAMAPDESAHFLRAFELSQGELITPDSGGSDLPAGIMSFRDPNATLDWDNKSLVLFPQTASYSLISYLPQTIGIRVASLLTRNVYWIYYGGKIGNALVCLLLCAWALYITPYGRKVLFVIMSFPMAMQQMVTLSPDGFTVALSLIFLAYVVHLRFRATRVRFKDILVLTVVGFCLAVCKTVYLALLLLLFLIPTVKFSSKRFAFIFRFGFILLTSVAVVSWYCASQKFAVLPGDSVNSIEQIRYVLSNISTWFNIPMESLYVYGSFWIESMVGSSLGALEIVPPAIMSLLYLSLLVYEVCSCYVGDTDIQFRDIVIMLLCFLAGAGLAMLAMYAAWTPVGCAWIEGIQGRYFLPVIAFLVFTFILGRSRAMQCSGIKLYNDQYRPASFVYLMVIYLNGLALMNIARYYFVLA